MAVRLLIAAFLLAHATVHAAFLSPRPPLTAGGPAWPFELGRSWILGRLGIDPGLARILGVALIALTFAGFAVGALAALGPVPAGLFPPAIVIGSVASMAVLALFFQPWLALGVAIDLAVLWVVLVAHPAAGDLVP